MGYYDKSRFQSNFIRYHKCRFYCSFILQEGSIHIGIDFFKDGWKDCDQKTKELGYGRGVGTLLNAIANTETLDPNELNNLEKVYQENKDLTGFE